MVLKHFILPKEHFKANLFLPHYDPPDPLKSKGNRNFLPKSSFWPKFLFLLKETETNFCLFGFGLAETENLLQILVVNRNFGRNLVSSEPQHKIPCMMVLTISCLHLAICHSVLPPPSFLIGSFLNCFHVSDHVNDFFSHLSFILYQQLWATRRLHF